MKIKSFIPLAFLFSLFLFSCATSRVEEDILPDVNPLALLSDDSSVYIKVPVKKHKELVSAVLVSRGGVGTKNASTVSDYLDVLYAGLGTVEDRSRMEIASSHSIPGIALNTAFAPKNGWEHKKYTSMSPKTSYPYQFTIYSRPELRESLCFLSGKTFVFSKETEAAVDKFVAGSCPAENDCNRWLSEETDDILFYITRPGQYLRNLIGQSITLGAESIYGSVHAVNNKTYYLSFSIKLTNKRAATALKSLLTLSFSMAGGTVEQTDEQTLKVSGIEIQQKKLLEFFTRDPITGKHYSVVNDQIIEENVKKQ